MSAAPAAAGISNAAIAKPAYLIFMMPPPRVDLKSPTLVTNLSKHSLGARNLRKKCMVILQQGSLSYSIAAYL
jgi:hypothetical protein